MPKPSRLANMAVGDQTGEGEGYKGASQIAKKDLWNNPNSWKIGSHQRLCWRGETH